MNASSSFATRMMQWLTPFAFVATTALAGCQQSIQELPTDALCHDGGRSYHSLGTGKELCENQHLVASLDPFKKDAVAGQGALSVPLRITRTETRDYCFVDDDGERHKIVITDESGRVRLRATAGDACVKLALEPGVYTTRIEHERPGERDAQPDIIHTRLTTNDGNPALLFQVNACPGCNLSNVEELPCWGGSIFENALCGIVGDYRGATLGGICDQNTETDISGEQFNATCVFIGDFTDATINVQMGYLGDEQIVYFGDPHGPRHSSFAHAILTGMHFLNHSSINFRNVDFLTGSPPSFANQDLYSDTSGTEIDRGYNAELMNARSYDGWPMTYHPESPSLHDRVFDFKRATLLPLDSSGKLSFDNVDLRRATLRNMTPLRNAGTDLMYRNALFSGATIENSQIDGTNFDGAKFDGATLQNVTFLRANDRVVSASGLLMDGATIDGVTFGEDHKVSATGALDFTFGSGASFKNSRISKLTFYRAGLANATFAGAQIDRLTARTSDLSSTDLTVGSLRLLDVSSSVFGGSFAIDGGRVRRLSGFTANGADIRTPFPGWSFDNAALRGATIEADFAGAQFTGSSLQHAIFACPKDAAGVCQTSLGSYDQMRFTDTDLEYAMILWSMKDAAFDGSKLSSSIFVAPLARTTFTRGFIDGARFCQSVPAAYTGLTFSNLNMSGVVMPLTGTTFTDASFKCAGGILASERDSIRSSTVGRCPNDFPPTAGDCKGAEWTPVASAVPSVCCAPADPKCDLLNPRQPCLTNCQCASSVCLPSQLCE